MRTCIISGGMIEPDFAFPYLQKQQFDIILAADRGLEFCYHYQIMPTYILGDFDSLSPKILNYYKENHVAPIREFNPMKDNTDTDIAFQQAIVLGSSEITILGATGGRLDHFLSIVQNLKTAWEKKIPAYIVDSRNLITIPVETSFEIRKEEQFGKYVSFFPLEKEVASITLEGFAYPLDHHYLPNTSGGLCVSNEIVEETAHVAQAGCIVFFYKVAAAVVEPVADKRIAGCLKGMAQGGMLYLKLMGYCVMLIFLTIALTVASSGFIY